MNNKNMENITDYLRDKYGPWGWMGQRAHDACGINHILPLDFIISCDYGTDIPYYFREDDVFSVEKQEGIRKDWSNEDLNANFKGALGRKIIERWNSYEKQVSLLCYRSVKRLENGSGRMLWKPAIYAVPEKLKKFFDNKVLLYKNMPGLSLPRIPGRVGKPGKNTFSDLRAELSLPFVIQFPYGSSGHFTFIIREEKEYNRLREKYPGTIAVMRKYVDGFSLNVNAVIVSTPEGAKTVCSFPSVQIAGIPECSNFSSAFCGNDYTAALDLGRKLIGQVESHIRTVGAWMAEAGYRGVFGMDFVVDEETVYPVEINPRFQNSTSLHIALNAMSRSGKGTSLFLLHIAEFLQDKDKMMRDYVRKFPERELMRPVKGSQVILHNRMRQSIVKGELSPGAYRPGKDGLMLIRKGASLDICREDNDILITCGVPGVGKMIEPNAPICKVQMRGNALDNAGKRELSPETRKIIYDVYNKLKLKNVHETEMTTAGAASGNN
jgi:predicted ATP-grasp superfamily ATP-dependent carboligase